MPNLWSTTLQQLYECFNGPRSIDYEFEKKAQEFKLVKERINLIKQTLFSFPGKAQGMLSFCNDVYNYFSLAYEKEKCYYAFIDDVSNAHKALENEYSNCKDLIYKIAQDTVKWDSCFAEIESLMKQRSEKRKTYDHYDEKMEKLVKERNERFAKNKSESTKDVEIFERNEEKFKTAAADYVKISNHTYYKIQDFLDSRYPLLTQVIAEFIIAEQTFYSKTAEIMSYFKDLKPKLQRLESNFQKTPIKYNAVDFLRGRNIIGKSFTDNLNHTRYTERGIIHGSNDSTLSNNQQQVPIFRPPTYAPMNSPYARSLSSNQQTMGSNMNYQQQVQGNNSMNSFNNNMNQVQNSMYMQIEGMNPQPGNMNYRETTYNNNNNSTFPPQFNNNNQSPINPYGDDDDNNPNNLDSNLPKSNVEFLSNNQNNSFGD